MNNVEFRVLGPVEVVRGGVVAPLSPGALTDLLATLIMSADQVVPAETMIETVWHDRHPVHPRATLHSAVSRLRRMIGGDFIQTLPSGYLFRAEADRVDLLRFERLRASANQPQAPEATLATLTEAVELWRGLPLENVVSPVLLGDAVPRLTQLYLRTCEEWAEVGLRTGQHGAVVPRLATLVHAHPFRERMAELLMLALYRSGRQADALTAYESVRQLLSDEMGIDPGPALRDLHLKILRADPSLHLTTRQPTSVQRAVAGSRRDAGLGWTSPSPVVIPRQLPRDLPDFCGRQDELELLTRLLTQGKPVAGDTPVVVISGKGGIGKTALAVQAAHRVSAAFPDGQLIANLRGPGLRLTPTASILASFLRALGVNGAAVPRSIADRVAMFRSLTAGRRVLIVLDNAASENQVRPLLPASASCAVIITSRARLTGLAGARVINLDVLDERDAINLLGTIIGPERVAAEQDDARLLTSLCGGLPLALRIVGTRLAAKAHWPLATLASRLGDERSRLNELAHGDLDVRATFAISYEALDGSAQAMLRRLSLLDAPDFAAWAGAAMMDITPGEAAEICERLVDAQLLDPAPRRSPGDEIRYQFHDLTRAFARDLATDAEPEAARTAALDRAFGAWLALAEQAHRRVYGGDYTILHSNAPRWTKACADQEQGIERNPVDWLEGERLAILAVVQQCAETGRHEVSWDLAWTAVTLYEARAYYEDWAESAEQALSAARSAGDVRGTASMLACLASLKLQTGQPSPQAHWLAVHALDLFIETADTHGCAITLYRLGLVHTRAGNLDPAINMYEQSRRVASEAGDPFMEAGVLRELARAHLQRGELETAAGYLAESIVLHREIGSLRGQAITLHMLAKLRLRQGDPESAIGLLRRGLDIIQATSDLVGQAHLSVDLGEALASAALHAKARERLLVALRLGHQVRNQVVQDRARQALDRLGQQAPLPVR